MEKYKQKEYHVPGFNYMGPGTRIVSRVLAKVKPINSLDAASMIHDIEYIGHNQFKADNNMYMNIIRQNPSNIPAANYIRTAFLVKDVVGYDQIQNKPLHDELKKLVKEYKLLQGYERMEWLSDHD